MQPEHAHGDVCHDPVGHSLRERLAFLSGAMPAVDVHVEIDQLSQIAPLPLQPKRKSAVRQQGGLAHPADEGLELPWDYVHMAGPMFL